MSSSLTTLQENVRNRIKESFVDLIPQEQWDSMVKMAYEDFVKNDLPKAVKDNLTQQLKSTLADEIAPLIQKRWNASTQREEPSAILRIILEQMAPELMTLLVQDIITQAAQKAVSHMKNGW